MSHQNLMNKNKKGLVLHYSKTFFKCGQEGWGLELKQSWKWPNELNLRTLQHAKVFGIQIFVNARLIRRALNFCIRRSNSRVSQSIASREKKKSSAIVARMWKVKSASSSMGSLSVKGCIHHHFEQISGYCKARTTKWEIFRVKYFCIYSGIRSIEQAFRVTVLTDMRTDYWFSSPKCSCINNSNKSLKLFSSFYFNFWLIINYWFILCMNNKKEFLNVKVNE